MDESDLVGMEGLSFHTEGGGVEGASAVEGVADDRESPGGEVHPELVSSAGFWGQLDEGVFFGAAGCGGRQVEDIEDLVLSEGMSSAVFQLADGLFFSHVAISSDGDVDDIGEEGGCAVGDGEIGFLDGAVFELSGDAPMGLIAFGDEHDACGISVKAMEDSGSPSSVDGTPFLSVMDEAIDQSAGPFSSSGVDHEVCLFVDREEMVILVEDVEGDRFGDDFIGWRGRRDHFDDIAGLGVVAGLDGFAVGFDQTVIDESLNGCA